MKILHFAGFFNNKASGLSFSVPNLIKSQNSNRIEDIAMLHNTKDGINLRDIDFNLYETFVLHSFFIPGYIKLLFKIPKNKKVIICPRGAFSSSNKYDLKKLIYAFVYFGVIKLRRLNFGIHFLTINEQKRSRFHAKNEFVVGNSIQITNDEQNNPTDHIQRKYNAKEIVFIGRFSKHIKGLDNLFLALKKNRDEILKHLIKFTFYGPEIEDKEWLKKYTQNNNLTFVSFFDEVYGEEKEKIFANAMFNILTSRSEGFPMAVLESSAFATPQILSKGTNLQESMLNSNFGIAFNDSFINEISLMKFEDYKIMCQNAQHFARQHSMENIGSKTIKYYIDL